MKKFNCWIILIMLLLITMTFSACTDNESKPAKDTGFTVTDMTGQEINLGVMPERIIALTPADCEIIFALGAGDLLVGRGEYCDYPKEALSVASLQSGSDINIEQIISLNPQVVIMSNMDQTEEQIKAIKDAGIKVVLSDTQNIDGVYKAIELIGKVVDKNDEAAELNKQMKSSFNDIAKKVEANKADKEEMKTVYFEVSPLEYGLWTAGSGTFMDEISKMLGVKNAFSDVSSWAEISQEQVIERNPDYIVTMTMYYGEGKRPEDEIMERAGWQNVTAVKNGDVFIADSDQITRPGPRLVDAAESLYKFIYK